MKAFSKLAAVIAMPAAAVACAVVPAIAQEASQPSEQVTVFAPYVVTKASTGPTKSRVTTVTMSRNVSFEGLDLTSADGQATLESRVKQAAADVCKELDRRYPSTVSLTENRNCVKQALDEAMIQVRGVEKAVKIG